MDYSNPPPLVDAYPQAADPLYPIQPQDNSRSAYYVGSPQVTTQPSLSGGPPPLGGPGASSGYPFAVGAPGATPYAGPGFVLSPSLLTPNATPYVPAGAGGIPLQAQAGYSTPATLYAAYPYPQSNPAQMMSPLVAGVEYLSPGMSELDLPPSQRQRPTRMRPTSGSRGGGGGGGLDTDWAYYQEQAEAWQAQQQRYERELRARERAEAEAEHARRNRSSRSRSRSRYDRQNANGGGYYDATGNPYPTSPRLRRSGEALDSSWAFVDQNAAGGAGGGREWDRMSASASSAALVPSPYLSRSRSLYGAGSGPRPQYSRPMEWREEYKPPKQGLARLFSVGRKESLSRNLLSLLGRTQIHTSLEFRSPPTIQWDIRYDPSYALTQRSRTDPHLIRFAGLELQEPATDPPSHYMRFMHAALPWYITIDTSWAGAAVAVAGVTGAGGGGEGFPYSFAGGPGGYGTSPYSHSSTSLPSSHSHSGSSSPHTIITIGHLLYTLYLELRQPIDHADYYNDSMTQGDREEISEAWMKRCAGSDEEAMRGVRRVDFLGEKCVFEGLVKRGNVWEIKTGRRRR